ncbi:MAG: lactonase family protein [Bacteroidetes bacterium]|jgi:6-phosphogluconolactonase|uniref:lactonase family protein n=1 Tax=Daejeonella sp. TaxID=2805397 RepID=UPI00404A55D1|nr:lactonase family protein [Bacteroidota bacterium]
MRNNLSFCIVLVLFVSGIENTLAQPGSKDIIYAGTSSARGSKGIYVLEFDRSNGKLKELQTVTEGNGPGFLALSPAKDFLYSIYGKGSGTDGNGAVMSFKIDPFTGLIKKLNEQSVSAKGPAHISIDPKGRFAYVSNYGGGSVTVLPINSDGSLAKASDNVMHSGSSIDPNRQTKPYPHSSIPSADGKFLYVCDLGTDKIVIYEVLEGGKLKPAKVPFVQEVAGSGPRHFKIHPNGNFAYSVDELSNTIVGFKVDKKTGELTILERLSMLPEGYKEVTYASDVHFSPDGKFIYASNRGHESLVIYQVNAKNGKLSMVGHEPTGGKHPRNFMIDRKGEFVLVGNMNTDNVVIFNRDSKTGLLKPNGQQYTIPGITCLLQL